MSRPTVRKNVALLALCQGLSNTSIVMVISVSALTGYMLADDKGLATLPHALMWTTTMATSPLAAALFQRVGRRAGFVVGALIGVLGALVAAYGTHIGQFWTFTAGIAAMGAFNSFAMFYRFAAAEAADEAFRAKAIALVIGGGVIAAFLGGFIANQSFDILPVLYSGTFAVLALVPLALAATVLFVDFPPEPAQSEERPGRPLGEIAADPRFRVAALAGAMSWAGMVMIMTATPISMKLCGLAFRPDVTQVIQWHIFAMFAPSFFSGWLIVRFGVYNVMIAGLVLFAGSVAVALAGVGFAHFWIMNFLIGAGWNFLFVGATEMLSRCHAPAERDKVQGLNDFIVFGSAALASFLGGAVLNSYAPDAVEGWNAVNLINIPGVLLVGAAMLWLRRARTVQPAE